jgi:hypothetical protein
MPSMPRLLRAKSARLFVSPAWCVCMIFRMTAEFCFRENLGGAACNFADQAMPKNAIFPGSITRS